MSFGVKQAKSESSGSKSSSSEQQRGFPEAQAKTLSEFFEPKLREFAIPYAESRILGKPISRLTTVPGTPSTLRTLSAGESPTYVMSTAGVRQRAPEGVTGSSRDALGAPYSYADELGTIWTVDPSSGPRTTGSAATPESTRTETVGFEPAPRTYPRLGTGGLFDAQRSGAGNLGNYAMSRLGGAPSPDIGDSGLRAAAPGLFDLIGQQIEKDVLKPEEQRQLNVQDLLAAVKLGVQGVGGSGSSVGQSFGTSSNSNWGFNVGLGDEISSKAKKLVGYGK